MLFSTDPVIKVIGEFTELWNTVSAERKQRIRQILPCLAVWLDIRNDTIATLEALAKKADKCQKKGSKYVNAAGNFGISMHLIKIIATPLNFANCVPVLNVISAAASAHASGSQAVENLKLRKIIDDVTNTLKEDSKESAYLDKLFRQFVELDKPRQNAATRIMIKNVKRGVFDSIGDKKTLETIKASSALSERGEIPSSIWNACFEIFEKLETYGNLNEANKQVVSKFMNDTRVLRELMKISAPEFAEIYYNFVIDPTLYGSDDVYTQCFGMAVQALLMIYKIKSLAEYNSRDIISVEIRKAIAELKNRKLVIKNIYQRMMEENEKMKEETAMLESHSQPFSGVKILFYIIFLFLVALWIYIY